MNQIYFFKELINGSNENIKWEAYIIQQIIVPICKMLIDKFFCSKGFLAEATTPLVHIKMDLMLLLFPKHVIFRTKPAFAWEFIFLLFHKGHQVLHKERVFNLQCHYGCTNAVSNTLHVLPHQQLSRLHGSFPLNNAHHVCVALFDEEFWHQVKTHNSSVLCPKIHGTFWHPMSRQVCLQCSFVRIMLCGKFLNAGPHCPASSRIRMQQRNH